MAITPQRNDLSSAVAAALVPLGALLTGPAFAQAGTAQTPETTLPTVQVKERAERENQGYTPGTTSIGKLPQLQRDIPQSLTIVPEQLIEDRAADTLKEALRNVPGLTFNAGEGGRVGDNFTLRGYSVVGDLYMDGLRDVAQYNREVFNLERIEVLRGSSSMLFGRGSTGGVINQVSKVPLLYDQYKMTATYGSYDYKRVTTDLNKPIGDNAAVRLNAMWTDADSFRDEVSNSRWGIAPSVRWGIGTKDEFTVSYYYLEDNNIPDLGVPYFNGRPLNVPVQRFYGMANADSQKDWTGIGTASWIHRFDADTNIKTTVRKADYRRDLWAVAPRLPGGITSVNDNTTMNRQRQARGSDENTLTLQSDFTTKLTTGSVKHLLLAGVEVAHEEMERWSYANTVPNPSTTVGNPNPYPFLTPAYYDQHKTRTLPAGYKGNSLGIYAQDFIELTPQWKVLLGARWDQLKADYNSTAANGVRSEFQRDDSVWSYRTGLIWQPTDAQSYYLAYGTSFNPSAELYQLTLPGTNTPPEKNRNMEAGAKWDLLDGDLFLRTAIFRTEKTNERNTDLSNPSVDVLSGKRHTDGIEIETAGRITSAWEVFGGVAFMKANIDEVAPTAPAGTQNTLNKRPLNTPPYTASLWTTYRLGGGWRIGGGIEAVGNRWANNANTNLVPHYSRVDALIAYEQRRYAVRLNIYNLLDKDYYEGVYQGHVIPGTTRTALLSVELKYD